MRDRLRPLLLLVACCLGVCPRAWAQEEIWTRKRQEKEAPSVPAIVSHQPFIGDLGERYSNYAFRGYQNYDTFGGRPPWINIYDPLGNFLINGQHLYSWNLRRSVEGGTRDGSSNYGPSSQAHMNVFNGILSIGGENQKGWAGRLILSHAPLGTGDPELDFFSEGIITRFTPLTLNQTSLHGARADVLTPFGDALSLVVARRYKFYDGRLGFNSADSALLLGGHYERRLGALRIGATYVNQHLFDLRNPVNSLRGDLHSSEVIPALLAVRISDDSPQDGRGGPVVYGIELIVNGRRRPDLRPDVVRQDLGNRFTTVGKTSRMTGEFRPSTYFNANIGRTTGPYRGMEPPLFADYLYRRDYERDPTDQNVAKNADVERLVRFVGWEDPESILRADGTEYLVYYFNLEGEPHVRSVEIEATVGNDYRIEVSALSVGNRVSSTYEGRYDAPFYKTIRRAPGNIQDLSNLRKVRIPLGPDTGQSVWGSNIALDLPGVRVRGEYARSITYRRYPDGTPGEGMALAGGVSALREWNGVRHRTQDRAWYLQVQREVDRYGIGAEVFSMGPMFNERMTLRPGDVALANNPTLASQNIYSKTTFLSFLEDNDDKDSTPETILMGTNGVPDFAVFPGWDADNDGIPDINRNANNVPDYLEPFLIYHVDPEAYVYGPDFNNNDLVDRLEDDREEDLPYDRDLQGRHVYARWQVVPRLDVTGGWLDSRQIAGGGRNDQRYIRLRYEWERSQIGELIVENELKRVWDDVPDDVFSWAAAAVGRPGGGGAIAQQLIQLGGRFIYRPQFVTDPLNYRDSLVNRFYLSATLNWLRGWQIATRLKVARNQQRAAQFADGTEQSRDRIRLFAWVQQADYTYQWRRLQVVPAIKGLWLKQTRQRIDLPLIYTRTLIPLITTRVRLSEVTELKAGIQGPPGWWYRVTDLADPRNSFAEQTITVVLSNLTPYRGYRLSTNLGITNTKRRFKDPFRFLEDFDTTSLVLRVILGNEVSTLY